MLPPNYTEIPFCDTECRSILRTAVEVLVLLRGGYGDAGATVSVLASLIAAAQDILPAAVWEARDSTYTWQEIADRLGTSTSAARHRYAADANWRRDHPRF